MNVRIGWLAGLVALVLSAPGADAQPAPFARESYPTLAPSTMPAIETAAMPTPRIENPILLDQQIEGMRAAIPGFNCVIVRDPGVADDYPMIPVMTLKSVTVGQFLQFVEESFPGMQVRRIDGPEGSLYSIRIRLDEGAVARAREAQESNRVRLYRLAEVINALADAKTPTVPDDAPEAPAAKGKSREERIKEATSEVLSLVQAALDETGDGEPHSVKIHEPTLTLLFKGSPTKQAVLQDALVTLHPAGRWSPAPSLSRRYPGTSDLDEYGRAISSLTPQLPRTGAPAAGEAPGRWRHQDPKELSKTEDQLKAMQKELSARLTEIKQLQDELQRRAESEQRTTTQPAKE